MSRPKINWYITFIELLVVFLGVSAGFFLQNYGERRNEKQMETVYLGGFRSDLLENIDMLGSQIREDSTWLDRYDYALREVATNTLSYDSACSLMMGMASFSRFYKQNITYTNIISSGNLGLIRDYDLKQSIVEYHKKLDNFDLIEEYYITYSQDQFIPYMIETFDVFDLEFHSPDDPLKISFKNHFATIVSFRQQRISGYRELLELSRELLRDLQESHF